MAHKGDRGTSVETLQTVIDLDIGNGMSLNTSDEGDDFRRTSSVSFSYVAANSLKLMMTFGCTCNVFACRRDNASAGPL